MNQPNCIILGDNYYNTYGVLRSLGETGIRPVFINVCSSDSWVSKSSFFSSYNQVSSYDEGIQIMMTHYGSEKTKPVVFCTSDAGICAVDKVSDTLSESFIIPHASKEQGRINKLINKNVMSGIARDAGMFVPRSVTITPSDYSESELECVEYPCHLKPSSSLYGAKQDMRICRNRDELIEALDELKTRDKQVEVQEYIDKDYEIVIMGCALKSGKVVLPGTIVKTREWPFRGVTSATRTVKGLDGMDYNSLEKFIELSGYYGIFSLEFAVQKGRHFFLEANFRSDANNYSATASGVNIPYLWYLDALGKDIEELPQSITRETMNQVEFVDFDYYKHHPLRFYEWVTEVIRADSFMIFNKKDSAPFQYVTRHPWQLRLFSLMFTTLNMFKKNV